MLNMFTLKFVTTISTGTVLSVYRTARSLLILGLLYCWF